MNALVRGESEGWSECACNDGCQRTLVTTISIRALSARSEWQMRGSLLCCRLEANPNHRPLTLESGRRLSHQIRLGNREVPNCVMLYRVSARSATFGGEVHGLATHYQRARFVVSADGLWMGVERIVEPTRNHQRSTMNVVGANVTERRLPQRLSIWHTQFLEARQGPTPGGGRSDGRSATAGDVRPSGADNETLVAFGRTCRARAELWENLRVPIARVWGTDKGVIGACDPNPGALGPRLRRSANPRGTPSTRDLRRLAGRLSALARSSSCARPRFACGLINWPTFWLREIA
jgi:hypothetical protein